MAEKSRILRKLRARPGATSSFRWPKSKLWTFSLKFYARPEVASACLWLQDNVGLQDDKAVDVNILLLCLWLASLEMPPLTQPMLESLDQKAAGWRRQIILPLRRTRRNLAELPVTAASNPLKRQILKAELTAEHQAQLELERAAINLLSGTAGTASNSVNLSPPEIAAISLGHYLDWVVAGDAAHLSDRIRLLAANVAKGVQG